MDDSPAPKRHGLGDSLRRLLDQREEERADGASQSAVLNHRGARHVVRLVNVSSRGAMVAYQGDLAEGEEVSLQLLDHGPVAGQVLWTRDGRVGIAFSSPLD